MSITDLAIYNGGNIDFYIDNYKDIELQYDKHISELENIILQLKKIIIVEEFTDDNKEILAKYNTKYPYYWGSGEKYVIHYLGERIDIKINNNIYIDKDREKFIILRNIANNESFLNNIKNDILLSFDKLITFFKENKNNLFSINRDKYLNIFIDNHSIVLEILQNIIVELYIIITSPHPDINNYNFLKKYNFTQIFYEIYNFIHFNMNKNRYKIDDTIQQMYENKYVKKIKTENIEYKENIKKNKEEIANNNIEIQLLKYNKKNIIKDKKKTEDKYSTLIKIIGFSLFIFCIISLLFNIYSIMIGRFQF